jgi:hypothetical protein
MAKDRLLKSCKNSMQTKHRCATQKSQSYIWAYKPSIIVEQNGGHCRAKKRDRNNVCSGVYIPKHKETDE